MHFIKRHYMIPHWKLARDTCSDMPLLQSVLACYADEPSSVDLQTIWLIMCMYSTALTAYYLL